VSATRPSGCASRRHSRSREASITRTPYPFLRVPGETRPHSPVDHRAGGPHPGVSPADLQNLVFAVAGGRTVGQTDVGQSLTERPSFT
jgi:hypothetical protein